MVWMASLMKRGIIVFVAALLAGAAFGLVLRRDESDGTMGATEEKGIAARQRERKEQRPRPGWSRAELLEAAAKLKIPADGGNVAHELAGWSDDEIRAALAESMRKSEWLLEGSPTIFASREIFKVWMERDFDAALDWFRSLDQGFRQQTLAEMFIRDWPAERGAEGLALVREHPEMFESYRKLSIVARGIEAEAARGPHALAGLLGVLESEGLLYKDGFFVQLTMPENFDYATLADTDSFRGIAGTAEWRTILKSWMGDDREQALEWLMENQGGAAVVQIDSPVPGESEDHYKWLGGKLENWPEEERAAYFEAGANRWRYIFGEVPRVLSALVEGVSDPVIADEVRAVAIQGIFMGQTAAVLPVLEAMDPGMRIDFLLEASPLMPSHDTRKLDTANETALRAKLAEWQADAGEIETIIGRFKQ